MAKRKRTSVPAAVADFDDANEKVRRAARILSDAEDIRSNTAFMKQVKAEVKIQQAALTKVMKR
ncbi:hypothetical protein LCGC14_2889470 [marine sediment metagenome]|uniref:Uncharacterized protein n=1 Tax=marine sediment metagenome TaxID=412755 RepID=A0A0F8XY08_9ZZZZ